MVIWGALRMAARSVINLCEPQNWHRSRRYLHGLAQVASGLIKDKDLIVRRHNSIPIYALRKRAGTRTIGQGDCVWHRCRGFSRETHDKHCEDG